MCHSGMNAKKLVFVEPAYLSMVHPRASRTGGAISEVEITRLCIGKKTIRQKEKGLRCRKNADVEKCRYQVAPGYDMMNVVEKIAKANIGIGNGKRLAPPTDPLDTGVEVGAEAAADVGVDDVGDIDVDSLDDDNVLDETIEGDVATLEGVATGGCSDVFGKVPTVIVDVMLEAVERVRDAGIGIFEVAAGSGLSNEPDIPTRLTSETCQLQIK